MADSREPANSMLFTEALHMVLPPARAPRVVESRIAELERQVECLERRMDLLARLLGITKDTGA